MAAPRNRAATASGYPILFLDHHGTIALEMLLVPQGRDCTSLGRTAKRIGIKAVLDPDQRLNQPIITDRLADTQAGQGSRSILHLGRTDALRRSAQITARDWLEWISDHHHRLDSLKIAACVLQFVINCKISLTFDLDFASSCF
jgi:hypothetical protein